MRFGWQELVIILVIVVIIFGGSKIAGLGKSSGRAIREFKEELKGLDTGKDDSSDHTGIASNQAQDQAGLTQQSPADTTPPGQTDLR